MASQRKTSTRITRNDWVNAGRKVLINKGINAVTVDALASELGLTRGSFYHHFKNREELSTEMLDHWVLKQTVEIRDDVAVLGLDGYQTLQALGNLIRYRGGADYDVAVRAWSHNDPKAMAAVRKTDKIRLEFITKQFRQLGFESIELENRSRLFLYFGMAEPMFTKHPDKKTTVLLDKARLNLLTSRADEKQA